MSPLDTVSAPWSDELEALHEEESRTHFIDVWTRRAMVSMVPPRTGSPTIIDLGSSTGYLLEDLSEALPYARLIGLDLVFSGLRKTRSHLPGISVAQADCCVVPLADGVPTSL